MSVIVLLIVAGGLVAGSFLVAFLYSVRKGQFDDMTTPPLRMLTQDRSHADSHPLQKVSATHDRYR